MKGRILLLGLLAALVLAGFVALTPSGTTSPQKTIEQQIADYNLIVGTQTVGAKYQFTDESMLVETAKAIRDMGSNLLKFSMHPRYSTENYGLPHNEDIQSLTDLATLEPSMREVLAMDFPYYHIWVYGFSQYTQEPVGRKVDSMQIKFIDGYSQHHADALYDELYELTAHLLTEYQGSGKTFYLGHWEGDWHLRWHYDRTQPADPETLEGMIAWEKVRQQAIDDAKRDHPSDVQIYNYIEVNLVRKGMEEPDFRTVTNAVLPEVNPDYVSYSSYDATNPYHTEAELAERLQEALDYIESQLPPKEGLPEGKRVWIGEYGNPAAKYDEVAQDERSKWTIKAGLEWGAPFILYWEMYNNEIHQESSDQVGYWLIDDKGNKQKVWHTHQRFYEESEAFLRSYHETHGQLPTADQFRQAAVNFEALQPEAAAPRYTGMK